MAPPLGRAARRRGLRALRGGRGAVVLTRPRSRRAAGGSSGRRAALVVVRRVLAQPSRPRRWRPRTTGPITLTGSDMTTDIYQAMLDKMRNGKGFIAALDQSGGSTPKALKLYGLG